MDAAERETAATVELPSLIGDVITEEELWACTTCRNCEDQCPVGNEHVDKIIDLRRYLVMTEGNMPSDAHVIFKILKDKVIHGELTVRSVLNGVKNVKISRLRR